MVFALFGIYTQAYRSSILFQHPPQHWQQTDNKDVYIGKCLVFPNMVDCLEINFAANNPPKPKNNKYWPNEFKHYFIWW